MITFSEYHVKAIHIHEDFSFSTLRNDLAVIETEKPLFTDKRRKRFNPIPIYGDDLIREYETDAGTIALTKKIYKHQS